MQENSTLTNILSIAGAGLLILITGFSFLFFRGFVSRNIRYFLPIPPIGVAAYIYVYNLYLHNNGEISVKLSGTAKEVLISVAVVSAAFLVFVFLLIFFINSVRKLF